MYIITYLQNKTTVSLNKNLICINKEFNVTCVNKKIVILLKN